MWLCGADPEGNEFEHRRPAPELTRYAPLCGGSQTELGV